MGKGDPLNLEIKCYDFPCAALSPYAHLRLGVQERDEVRQDVPCTDAGAHFRLPLEAVIDPTTNTIIFRGSYVQGSRGARFVYLCWGAWGEGGWQHIRRAKISLEGLDRVMVERALQEQQPLRVRVRMTDPKGQPVAAMLKAEQLAWGS